MAGKEDNDAMIVGIAAILKQQAEDNQAQMRELLKTQQEMMTQAQAPLAEAVRTVDVRPQQGLSEATVPRFDKILSADAFIKRLRDWFEDQNHTSESIRMNLIINTMMENKERDDLKQWVIQNMDEETRNIRRICDKIESKV